MLLAYKSLIKCPKVGNKKYTPNKYGHKNHKFNTFEFISLQGIPLSELAIKTAFFWHLRRPLF